MKKALLLLTIIATLLSCKKEKSAGFTGNWLSKDYIEQLDKNQGNTSKISGVVFRELVFPYNMDSLVRVIDQGINDKFYTIEVIGKRKVRVDNFNEDLYTDFELSSDEKTITYHSKSEEKTYTFIKVDPSEFKELPNTYSYAAPYLNKKLIAGDYINISDSAQVHITESGVIKGLDENHCQYSICTSGNCRNFSKGSTMFISNKTGEGFYYEYEMSKDTLKIYKLNSAGYPNKQGPFERLKLLYSLTKQ